MDRIAAVAASSGHSSGVVGCNKQQDCERVVFVTSIQFDPDEFGDLAGANEKCNEVASSSNHGRVVGRKFVAWLSNANVGPSTAMLHGSKAYVLPGKTVIANDWGDLTDGSVDNVIDENEKGEKLLSSAQIWTGTTGAGEPSGNHCNDWTNAAGEDATVGSTNETNAGQWTADVVSSCDTNHSLDCFEE